jgi:GNAT superfamily N-acetyltransferase
MSETITIREYRPEDAEPLLELMRELQGDLIPLFDRMLPLAELGAWYRDEMLADGVGPRGRTLVAELGGRLVGYAIVLLDQSSEEHRDEVLYTYAIVAELLVSRKLRGKGLGTQLLAECERIAKERGNKWLRIEVLARNGGARRLYERSGFSEHLVMLEKAIR